MALIDRAQSTLLFPEKTWRFRLFVLLKAFQLRS
jgi:hypothetical protein